jgi:hypothetical protein
MTVSGVWHEPLRVAFRAAPDLYLWDGETIPAGWLPLPVGELD